MDAGRPRARLWTADVPSGRARQEEAAAAGLEELPDDELPDDEVLDDEVPDEPVDGVPDVLEEVLDDVLGVESVEVLDEVDDEPDRESVR